MENKLETDQTLINKTNKRFFVIMFVATIILLIPLTAMQFTNEVKWTLVDFIAAGILLFGAGLTLEFILRKIKIAKIKIAACVLLIVVFFLVWAELAVGLFGTPIAGH